MSKNLSLIQIEDSLANLINNHQEDNFIFTLLELYGFAKTTINRERKNGHKVVKVKNKLHYQQVDEGTSTIAEVARIESEISNQKSKPRFIVVTDFIEISAKDIKTGDTMSIPFSEFPGRAEFFLPWTGVERIDLSNENIADVKASERFTRFYDELVKLNQGIESHALNIFLIRLLFMLFAEDSGIMDKGSFTNAIKIRTNEDGSDLNEVIKEIFETLDISDRKSQPEWLQQFPYVNGKLFRDVHVNMNFDKRTRKLIIEAGELLDWSEINPDILGSMIQNVANNEQRTSQGMHYTSVPDIMKLIGPLFLDDLTQEYLKIKIKFEENEDRKITEKARRENKSKYIKELRALQERLSNIRFLDPACGSGNFLIITYKELRRLEIKILKLISDIENNKQMMILTNTKIKLNNFYGIELEDFAHEVARLSLWIAEHQMNIEMTEALVCQPPALLPLKDEGNIINANALRINWNDVFPVSEKEEAYIIGNPPYKGTKGRNPQNSEQKQDLAIAIAPIEASFVDYIFGWFIKASRFIYNKNIKYAFVSTNSIFQGEQAPFFLKNVLNDVEILFAYPSFKWKNQAKNNAGVTVAIAGIGKNDGKDKYIYRDNEKIYAENINVYLEAGENIFVKRENKPSKELPFLMNVGSAEYGENNLILSIEERNELIDKYPEAEKYVKKCINATNLMNGTYSFVLWIEDQNVDEARKIPFIADRIERVRLFRSTSERTGTKKGEKKPWAFTEIRHKEKDAIILPVASSANRDYLPVAYIEKGIVSMNANCLIYDAPIWLLGILSSKMHTVWLRAVGGKLKTDFRYSPGMVYNTFPVPSLSTQRKNMIEEQILNILDLREEIGGTLAELYNNSSMPSELREAHEELDRIFERAYQDRAFNNDQERLSRLLSLYQEKSLNK